MIEELIRGIAVVASIIAVSYVFVRVLQATGSFSRALLAVSIILDFILVVMFILGVDKPLFTIYFRRIELSITITALTLFIPLKIYFTIYILLKQKQLTQFLT